MLFMMLLIVVKPKSTEKRLLGPSGLKIWEMLFDVAIIYPQKRAEIEYIHFQTHSEYVCIPALVRMLGMIVNYSPGAGRL